MVKGINEIYMETVKKALEDGIITRDESHLLKSLRKSLGISESFHENIEDKLRKSEEITDLDDEDELNLKEEIYPHMYTETYKNAVVEALKDSKITQDEFRILDYLRDSFSISLEEHGEIESTIRDDIGKTYKPGVADVMWDRFNFFVKVINKNLEEKIKNK